jgi:NitT/TauT family transport system permease protein
MRNRVAQVVSLVAVLVVWALLAIAIGDNVLPGPIEVAPELGEIVASGRFLGPLVESLTRTAVGFTVGFLVGFAIGLAMAKVPWFSVASTPLTNVVLFAPTLVVIYLGIAIVGTNLLSIAIITCLAVAPNVAIYMRDVMGDFDPDLSSMADSFRVPARQRIVHLYLPYLIPPILAVARIGFSMAWKVTMLSEVFGFAGGLGFQIRINYGIYNLTALLAWLAVFVIALLLIEQLIRGTEKALVRWQP